VHLVVELHVVEGQRAELLVVSFPIGEGGELLVLAQGAHSSSRRWFVAALAFGRSFLQGGAGGGRA
jgi:hypothetical protein